MIYVWYYKKLRYFFLYFELNIMSDYVYNIQSNFIIILLNNNKLYFLFKLFFCFYLIIIFN